MTTNSRSHGESRLLLAPDSFKGSLRAHDVGCALREGLLEEGWSPQQVSILGMGDGGEGSLDAWASALGVDVRRESVCGPLGGPVAGAWALSEQTAWVEAASACGLELLPASDDRGPMGRTSHGVGELIGAAVSAGARTVLLGCGGTATVDLGLGMLQALGAEIVLDEGAPEGPLTLAELPKIKEIKLGAARERLRGVRLVAAVDVFNPLTGAEGTARYAEQKGLPTAKMPWLLDAVAHAGRALEAALVDEGAAPLSRRPGGGAAGGIPASVMALGGVVEGGFSLLSRQVGFDAALSEASWVVTGEGKLDGTSAMGKVVHQVLERAQVAQTPTWLVVGQATAGGVEAALDAGASMIHTLTRGADPDADAAFGDPRVRLRQVGRQMARTLRRQG